jgi:methionyl-tRNA formyltransferase
VKQLASEHHLPVYQPPTLKDANEQKKLSDLKADLMVVVAYGLILPKAVLEAPRLGCINIHASLLPRWRGAAPIQRSILAGDLETGITIMQMDEGLDTGPMLYKATCPINKSDTSEVLQERLALLGTDALLFTLDHLSELNPELQNHSLATYAHKISKEEAEIKWSDSAASIARQVNAFNPWPVAYTHLGDNVLRIWEASVIEKPAVDDQPGQILNASSDGMDVATGSGILRLLKIQLPGGRVLPVKDILNSRRDDFAVGIRLG